MGDQRQNLDGMELEDQMMFDSFHCTTSAEVTNVEMGTGAQMAMEVIHLHEKRLALTEVHGYELFHYFLSNEY